MAGQAKLDARLIYELRRVTEKTALAAFEWIGQGKSVESDQNDIPQFRKGEKAGRKDAATGERQILPRFLDGKGGR